jgi:VanZ family protein
MRLSSGIALTLTGILLVAVVFAPAPGKGRWIETVHDTAHAPIFGCLAGLSLFLLRARERFRSSSIPRQYLAALVLTTLLGASTEIAQHLTGREASFADLARDVLGAAAFLVLYAAFDSQIRHVANPWRIRSVGVASALLVFAILGTPLARAALEYRAREQRFPVLADFSQQFDSYFFAQNRVKIELRPMAPQWSTSKDETTLYVQFATEPYPGIAIFEPAADWRGYSTLALDLTNPTAAQLRLVLRVNDAGHHNGYADRFNKVVRISPQTRSVVRVPLAEIEAAPATRRMDLSTIANVALFRAEPQDGTQMYVSRLWLE